MPLRTSLKCIGEVCKNYGLFQCRGLEEKGFESIVVISDGQGSYQCGSTKGKKFLAQNYSMVVDFLQALTGMFCCIGMCYVGNFIIAELY